MNTVTQYQLGLLHHTLGVRPDRREPYRNHFVAGRGHHDQPHLEELLAIGLMRRAPTPAFCDQGDEVFCVTEAGKIYALANLPEPPPPAKRSRYHEYLDADTGHSFAEFMGINVPVEEWNHKFGNKCLYRYVRYAGGYRWDRYAQVAGEWMPTKKAAKESYKAALKARRQCAKEAA